MGAADYTLEDPRFAEVVRRVQAILEGTTVEPIRKRLQMLDESRGTMHELGERVLVMFRSREEPTPTELAETIVDALLILDPGHFAETRAMRHMTVRKPG